MTTKYKTIILSRLDNGDRYITYTIDSDRFMLDKQDGSIMYPELSNMYLS